MTPTPLPDRLIKLSVVLVVLGLVAIASVTSYIHGTETIRTYGAEDEVTIKLFVGTIDALAFASSMTVLWAIRNRIRPYWLARVGLVLGFGATIAANAMHAYPSGEIASAIAAWPAIALIISYELLAWIIRTSRMLADKRTAELASQPTPVPPVVAAAPGGDSVQPSRAEARPVPASGVDRTLDKTDGPLQIVPAQGARLQDTTQDRSGAQKPPKSTQVRHLSLANRPAPVKPTADHDELVRQAMELLRANENMSGAAIGRGLRVSDRQGQRIAALAKQRLQAMTGTDDR